MVIFSLDDALKKFCEIFKTRMMALTLYLFTRITLALISSSAIIVCFQKVNFYVSNLVISNFELPSTFLYALVGLISSVNSLFYVKKYSVSVKPRDILLCLTNCCINVTSKLILPSISRFKFSHHYKSRVKQICT